MLDTIDTLVRGDRANLAQFPSLLQLVRVYRGDVYIKQLFLEVLQGLIVVLQDHDFRQIDVAAQQLCHFFVENSKFVGNSEEKAISLSKYLLALPMSRYAQRTLLNIVECVVEAALPDGAVAFVAKGPFKRWMSDHLYSPCARNAQLWWSWFQVKRNTPVVDEKFIHASYLKHEKMLTSDDPCPEGLAKFFGQDVDPVQLVQAELDHVSSKISVAVDAHVFQAPSTKACFAYGQAAGGQRRDVLSFLDPEGAATRELVSIDWFPVVHSKTKVYNALVETYAKPTMVEKAKGLDHLLAEETFSSVQGHIDKLESFLPPAAIYGICEPLKVRIISKGPGVLYWRCKPLQRAIWSALKELPVFRLIGRPVDILDVIENTRKKFLASVDYSSATDGSSQSVGMRMLRDMLKSSSISPRLLECAEKAFGPHLLCYKLTRESRDFDVTSEQRRGQLMGSILSFPILCLLNLATLRMAELFHGERIVDPLINGDDMLYSCDDPTFWEYQCEAARSVGLTPSLGKCYLSTHCFSINSVAFHRGRSGVVNRVEYLPTGLLHGKHKVSCQDTIENIDYEETLVSCFEVVCAGARKASTACRFLTYNAVKINQECQGRNLFFPQWMGGLGVRVPDYKNFKVNATRKQIEVAVRSLNEERRNSEHAIIPKIGPLNRNQSFFTDHEPQILHWTVGLRTTERDEAQHWRWRSAEYTQIPRKVMKHLTTRVVACTGSFLVTDDEKRRDEDRRQAWLDRTLTYDDGRVVEAAWALTLADAALGSEHNSPKRCDDPLNSSVPSTERCVASRDCTEKERLLPLNEEKSKTNAQYSHISAVTVDLVQDVQSRRAEGGLQNEQSTEIEVGTPSRQAQGCRHRCNSSSGVGCSGCTSRGTNRDEGAP